MVACTKPQHRKQANLKLYVVIPKPILSAPSLKERIQPSLKNKCSIVFFYFSSRLWFVISAPFSPFTL